LILVQYVLKTRLFNLESWGSASASLFPEDASTDPEDTSEVE
jgi:hypothetical protein